MNHSCWPPMWNMGGPEGETRIAARIRVMICHDVVKIIQPLWRTPVGQNMDYGR
jgi:hypothetical protein